ncbi:MAG: hypothetical protein AAFX40_07120, partial [Cyanobacteria bacterium J06639_1]
GYLLYGPLSNGATTLMFEGAPRKANPGCMWDVIEHESGRAVGQRAVEQVSDEKSFDRHDKNRPQGQR